MPLTLILARDLCKMIENLRQKFAFLKSDCKSQVTVNYFKQNGALIPSSVKMIVLPVHHAKNLTSFRDVFNEEILRLSSNDKRTRYDNLEHLNDMDLLRLFLKLQIQTFVLSKYEVISKNARFLIEPVGGSDSGSLSQNLRSDHL
ncbi:S-adenosylmethionine synthetase [Pseudoloma neurophilia]|uniref:S-adenosylmethionine synthetase n=1 Tax=Pseudoloma neurophilia TaxID=146866 RepID=A0A0R0M3E6_9MICR|nr:S-adenosylmethionine synthetase [Pseudoloma neurophilia]